MQRLGLHGGEVQRDPVEDAMVIREGLAEVGDVELHAVVRHLSVAAPRLRGKRRRQRGRIVGAGVGIGVGVNGVGPFR